MIKIGIAVDEVWPYFHTTANPTTNFHDVIVEVDEAWWEDYQRAADTFWVFQSKLQELHGYDG